MEPASRRLLVVDDDEGLLLLMTSALRREGYDVSTAESGKAALDLIPDNSPDLLLLDLNLGDMPASTLLEEMRTRGYVVPFVVITGQGDETVAVKMMKEGALDYVMKDTRLIELLPAVVQRASAVIERDRKLTFANQAIFQRERRLQTILYTALDGFASFDSSFRFLETNKALCELLKKSYEDLIGIALFDIIDTRLVKECRKQVTDLKSGASTRFFSRLCTNVEVEISLHRNEEEMFAFIHDISEQRRLEREVLQISEDERRRIGQELHDNLGQQLTALEFMSQTLGRSLEKAAPELSASSREISRHIRELVSQTRRLSHGLTPINFAGKSLVAALEELAHTVTAAGLKCKLDADGSLRIEDEAIITHLYRIAQEATTNVLKHASARHVVIQLRETPEHIELIIKDDGNGIANTKRTEGMGLHIMHYRARLIAGHLTIDSQPKNGVCITCRTPRQFANISSPQPS